MSNPPLPAPNDLEATWAFLENGIDQIMCKLDELSYKRYMDIYTAIYNYCHGNGNQVGSDLYQNLKTYLERHLFTIRENSIQYMDEKLLRYYISHWEKYHASSSYLHHAFRFLNRHWVKRKIDEGHKNIYDVYTLTLISWREHMFKHVEDRLMTSMERLIERQKNGEEVETELIKSVVESFASLSLDGTDPFKSRLDAMKDWLDTLDTS